MLIAKGKVQHVTARALKQQTDCNFGMTTTVCFFNSMLIHQLMWLMYHSHSSGLPQPDHGFQPFTLCVSPEMFVNGNKGVAQGLGRLQGCKSLLQDLHNVLSCILCSFKSSVTIKYCQQMTTRLASKLFLNDMEVFHSVTATQPSCGKDSCCHLYNCIQQLERHIT